MTHDNSGMPPLPEQALLATELAGHVLEVHGHTDEAMRVYGRQVAQMIVSICRDERVQTVAEEDEAYNMAIQHCTDAIRKRFGLERP